MAKKKKTIPEHIKDVIRQHGSDVVKSAHLLNILCDITSFDDIPAAKSVLRTLLKAGYGQELLNFNDDHWQIKVNALSAEICQNYGYQQDLVDYLLISICYGLGRVQTIPKYKSPGRRKFSEVKTQDNETSTLENEESSLKRIVAFALNEFAYHTIRTLLVAVAFLIALVFGISYLSSSDDREVFDQSIQKGDSFMASGQYTQALANYSEAYTNYDAFNKSSYQDDAFEKMVEAIDKMIWQGNTDSNQLIVAKQSIEEQLRLELPEPEKLLLTEKLKEVNADIEKCINNGRNSLILNISANDGKLDDNGRKLLDELLNLSPDDYWLKFIKNKEQ